MKVETPVGSRMNTLNIYTPEKAEMFLKRLKGCQGNVKLAATSLGLDRSVPQAWARSYPDFAEKLREARREAAKTWVTVKTISIRFLVTVSTAYLTRCVAVSAPPKKWKTIKINGSAPVPVNV
jgi:hypothetical protein